MVFVEEIRSEMVGVEGQSKNHQREMRELEEKMSQLNPLAREFVPPSHQLLVPTVTPHLHLHRPFVTHPVIPWQRKSRPSRRTGLAQRDEVIKRTVFVSDIDHLVTEEQLASLFLQCGQVVDCRICGDPKSVLRFAFIEFTDQNGARTALRLSGTMLGFYPIKVNPSKTAIAPVNPAFLPQSEVERKMCARTIYCTHIDTTVSEADLKLFFESVCGKVYRLRMLGDHHHPSRIAFVEFVKFILVAEGDGIVGIEMNIPPPSQAESATAALNCSGVVLGSLALRVSPSKTPVRPSKMTPIRARSIK